MSVIIASDKDSAKRDRHLLAQVLTSAGAKNADRKAFCCPFHDDKHPSAGVKESPSGFWYFHCYVCDINEDVWGVKARTTGMSVAEVLKEANPYQPIQRQSKSEPKPESFATIEDLIESYKRRNPKNIVEEINPYTNPTIGEADFYTLRIQPPDTLKTFRQVSRKDGRWQWSGLAGGEKWPLFNRVRIVKSETVLIVEGEKCVREVTRIGATIAATTSPGGALNANKADWSILAGKKCYIWRDNDEPGKQYERDVTAALMKLNPAVMIYRARVEELGLKEKGDVFDYLQNQGTNAEKVAALQLVLFDAEPLNVTSALEEKFAKIASGEFRAVAFPQKPLISEQSKAVMPGCLTTICGEPGSGKSFLILEDFWRWAHKGEIVRLLMLEDDNAFHQNRILAQMSGYSDLLDPDFVADHSEFTANVLAQYREPLESFSRNIETASMQMTLDEIAQWVINHAENNVRIIGVDPITAARASDKPWIDDQKFLFRVKPVLEQTGASLILTTHPRIGQAGKPSLSGIAGGASYPRFSQCVMWLKNLDKEQESYVWDGYINKMAKHKQIVQLRKARNGKGQGRDIAINLNFQNLCFDEIGIIEAECK